MGIVTNFFAMLAFHIILILSIFALKKWLYERHNVRR